MSSFTITDITSTVTAIITDTPTPAPTVALIADITDSSSSSSTTTSRRGFGQGPGIYGGGGLKEITPPGRPYNDENYVPPAPWILAIIFSIMGLIAIGCLYAWWYCWNAERMKLKQAKLAIDIEAGGQKELDQAAPEPQQAKKADPVVQGEPV